MGRVGRDKTSPPSFFKTAADPTPSGSAAVFVATSESYVGSKIVNAHLRTGMFDEIAERILRAVAELRAAISDGTAADPRAAQELADRMERYAASVLEGTAHAEPR